MKTHYHVYPVKPVASPDMKIIGSLRKDSYPNGWIVMAESAREATTIIEDLNSIELDENCEPLYNHREHTLVAEPIEYDPVHTLG